MRVDKILYRIRRMMPACAFLLAKVQQERDLARVPNTPEMHAHASIRLTRLHRTYEWHFNLQP